MRRKVGRLCFNFATSLQEDPARSLEPEVGWEVLPQQNGNATRYFSLVQDEQDLSQDKELPEVDEELQERGSDQGRRSRRGWGIIGMTSSFPSPLPPTSLHASA